jgi:hypothetical protein
MEIILQMIAVFLDKHHRPTLARVLLDLLGQLLSFLGEHLDLE